MKINLNSLISNFINFIYLVVIFLVALSISLIALARKINVFENEDKGLIFKVERETISLTSATEGEIAEVFVKEGQMVKKGDLLMKMIDETNAAKIASLESVADENISAKTEAMVLRAKSAQYEVRAYDDGVIYKIHSVAGSYVPVNTLLLTLFSNKNIRLITNVSPDTYKQLQKQSKLNVYSDRHEQVFTINFQGLSRIIPAADEKNVQYELYYTFDNIDDAMSFIQGENLVVTSQSVGNDSMRLGQIIQRFINGLLGVKS